MLQLDDGLISAVTEKLAFVPAGPDLAQLEQFVWRYTETVPWESASRIARRGAVTISAEAAQTPTQFWQSHLAYGSGGTCFESNLAFFSLLQALGYEGYLTINNMGNTLACHTAIVIVIDGQKVLVDVGLPIFAPLKLDVSAETHTPTPIQTYTVIPAGPFAYQIERAPHPSPNAFTLLDLPVAPAAYWAATCNDYGENGLFLEKVVINKVIDGQLWRFSTKDMPLRFEQFVDGQRVDWPIEEGLALGDWASENLADAIANRFQMRPAIIQAALRECAG